MPITRSNDDLPGPVRSQVWDAALGQLARYSYVELDAVLAELDAEDVTADDVRDVIDEGLVRLDWLQRPDDGRDVWLPDVRAFALMDLTRRGEEGTRRDGAREEPAPSSTTTATIAGAVV